MTPTTPVEFHILTPYIDKDLDDREIFDIVYDLPWKELSSMNCQYPPEILVKFKLFWDPSSLIQNNNVLWDQNLIKEFYYSPSSDHLGLCENLNIEDLIYVITINLYKRPISTYLKQFLSNRKDLTSKLLALHPELFTWSTTSLSLPKRSEISTTPPINISTNPFLTVDYDFIYRHRERLDFWAMALYRKLDFEVIYSFASYFDEIRCYATEYIKRSDWGSYNVLSFKSGWENLIQNPNIEIDDRFIKCLGDRKIKHLSDIDGWDMDIQSPSPDLCIKDAISDDNWITIKELIGRLRPQTKL